MQRTTTVAEAIVAQLYAKYEQTASQLPEEIQL